MKFKLKGSVLVSSYQITLSYKAEESLQCLIANNRQSFRWFFVSSKIVSFLTYSNKISLVKSAEYWELVHSNTNMMDRPFRVFKSDGRFDFWPTWLVWLWALLSYLRGALFFEIFSGIINFSFLAYKHHSVFDWLINWF